MKPLILGVLSRHRLPNRHKLPRNLSGRSSLVVLLAFGAILTVWPTSAGASSLDFWRFDRGYGEVAYARGELGDEELMYSVDRGALGGREYTRGVMKTLLVKEVEGSGWNDWRYNDGAGNLLVRVKHKPYGADYFDSAGKLVLKKSEENSPNRYHFTDAAGKLLFVLGPAEGLDGTNGMRRFSTDRRDLAVSSKLVDEKGRKHFLWTIRDPDDALRGAGVLLFGKMSGLASAIPPEIWFVILMDDEARR